MADYQSNYVRQRSMTLPPGVRNEQNLIDLGYLPPVGRRGLPMEPARTVSPNALTYYRPTPQEATGTTPTPSFSGGMNPSFSGGMNHDAWRNMVAMQNMPRPVVGNPPANQAALQRRIDEEARRVREYNERAMRESAAQRETVPSYEEAMRQYELDPLTQLYTGRKYAETPLSREQYDYLRLSDRFGSMSAPELAQLRRTEQPYHPGSGVGKDSYAYYQWLQGELKGQEEERKRREQGIREQANQILSNFPTPGGQQFVHFLSPEMRRVMGVTEADVAQSRRAYQQEMQRRADWEERKADIAAQNQRTQEQRLMDLQSLAARGFYQTPTYQNV